MRENTSIKRKAPQTDVEVIDLIDDTPVTPPSTQNVKRRHIELMSEVVIGGGAGLMTPPTSERRTPVNTAPLPERFSSATATAGQLATSLAGTTPAGFTRTSSNSEQKQISSNTNALVESAINAPVAESEESKAASKPPPVTFDHSENTVSHDQVHQTITPPVQTTVRNLNPPSHRVALLALPELSSRYLPTYTAEHEVVYKDPQRFCLKPGYWRRWSSSRYRNFAEHLRHQFDPAPFAREHDLPVDEVQHVFNALVCDPLFDTYRARKRGESGMEAVMELYQRSTPMRKWGGKDEQPRGKGELDGVEKGVVHLIDDAGCKRNVSLQNLSKQDVDYLKGELLEEDWARLFGGKDVSIDDARKRAQC